MAFNRKAKLSIEYKLDKSLTPAEKVYSSPDLVSSILSFVPEQNLISMFPVSRAELPSQTQLQILNGKIKNIVPAYTKRNRKEIESVTPLLKNDPGAVISCCGLVTFSTIHWLTPSCFSVCFGPLLGCAVGCACVYCIKKSSDLALEQKQELRGVNKKHDLILKRNDLLFKLKQQNEMKALKSTPKVKSLVSFFENQNRSVEKESKLPVRETKVL